MMFTEDMVEDVETRFDTSNFEIDRPLRKGRNKKVTNEKWISWTYHENLLD